MNPKHNRDRGKRTEQAIAERLQGTRKGIMGGHDVDAGPFAVEVKDRESFAGSTFMQQAIRNCPNDKTPLVIVHTHGKRHDTDLVMIRLADWQDWFGKLAEAGK
jgi:hypothetical protein